MYFKKSYVLSNNNDKNYGRMTVIPVVMCALGTIPKGLVKGLVDLAVRDK